MLDSVRARLTLWYVGVLALLLIVSAGATYFLLARVLSEEIDENLDSMVQNFKASVEAEREENIKNPDIEKYFREVVRESRFADYNYAVYDDGNREIAATSSGDETLKGALLSLDGVDNDTTNFATVRAGKKLWRVRSLTLAYESRSYRLFVLYSLRDQMEFLGRLRSIYFVVIPLALILTGIGGYFLARKSLAPVVDMSRRAATISATNLHERLPIKNEKDELGKLAQTFNALLLRLEDSFEQQRRFMADASHELRTPLAIVRGESEVALLKENRPAPELRESLNIVHDESKRLTKIVDDLLTLARADAGQFKIEFTKIYLDELLADCVRAVQVLAQKRGIVLQLGELLEIPVRGDEQLLHRLFLNLLDNAIKYNYEGGTISLTGEKDATDYLIRITNTGEEISDKDQEKIFDRFYRTDPARTREQGIISSGSGLGLSIARWIAELHHGTIEIVSSSNRETIFAVRLPLDKSKDQAE